MFGGGPYGDEQLEDDFYWGAAELWLATGEQAYRLDVLRSAQHHADVFDPTGFDFDRVAAPARLDLARLGGDLPDHNRVCAIVRQAANRLLELQGLQPWGQPCAPVAVWDGYGGRVIL